MSELTQCNFCSLREYRKRAKREGKIVTMRPAEGGLYVHIHRKSEELDLTPWDDGNKQIVAWFMDVGDSCVC